MFSFGSIIEGHKRKTTQVLDTPRAVSNHMEGTFLMATSDTTTKRCTHGENCLHPDGPHLPATSKYFYRDKNKGDGFGPHCKVCIAAYQSSRRADISEYQRQWRAKNPFKTREYQDSDEMRVYKRDWARNKRVTDPNYEHRAYLANKDGRYASIKKWRAKNPDRIRAASRAYVQRNRDHIRKLARERYWQDPENNRERGRLKVAKRRGAKLHAHELYEAQEGRCAYCGISVYRQIKNDVHIEHMQPIVKGGTNDLDNLVISCRNCNLEKHHRTVMEWQEMRGW